MAGGPGLMAGGPRLVAGAPGAMAGRPGTAAAADGGSVPPASRRPDARRGQPARAVRPIPSGLPCAEQARGAV
jgi:hypothetical protein